MKKQGFFIAIEGGDGSGKSTQVELISERLRTAGYNVLNVDFPQYGQPSAEIVKNYLNNAYGDALKIPADLASLPYAIDRVAAKLSIEAHLKKDKAVVLANRYTASNLAHQGTKFDNPEERKKFYQRLKQIEFEILQVPKPDLNLVLLVSTSIAQSNVDKKAARDYTTKKRDAHEASQDHLERAKDNYSELCQLYPDDFTAINCMRENDYMMRTIEEINDELWKLIQKII